MDANPPAAAAPAAPAWTTLSVASCNLLNLALPGRAYYANQPPYEPDEHERKLSWLGSMLARLNADIVGCQEVWDEAAWRAAVARSGLRYAHVLAPGAEQGATGTPRVGLATRLSLEAVESVSDFAPHEAVTVPEIGATRRVFAMVASSRRIEACAVSMRACVISTSREAASRSWAGRTPSAKSLS